MVAALFAHGTILSFTVAVTVREFHPLPYYPEPTLRHLKGMERTCKRVQINTLE
jgi:hypothetical protein